MAGRATPDSSRPGYRAFGAPASRQPDRRWTAAPRREGARSPANDVARSASCARNACARRRCASTRSARSRRWDAAMPSFARLRPTPLYHQRVRRNRRDAYASSSPMALSSRSLAILPAPNQESRRRRAVADVALNQLSFLDVAEAPTEEPSARGESPADNSFWPWKGPAA